MLPNNLGIIYMKQNIGKMESKKHRFIGSLPKSRLPQPILAEHPDWIRLYWLALKLGWENIRRDSSATIPAHMTCMPGVPNIWQWDSCFMALYSRFLNGVFPLAANLDIMYGYQRRDGFIAMAYDLEKGKPAYGEFVNPPLYAWTEWLLYESSGNADRLKTIFPCLVAYFDWLKKNRRRNNGLYWFEIPGASGMDNSPRGGSYDRKGSDVCHVDIASQQALSARHLARIAGVLGKSAMARRFESEYRDLAALVNRHHWHEGTGFYYDVFNDPPDYLHCNWLNHKTAAGFWPLLAGIAAPTQTSRLIEHLLNEREFKRPHMIPALSADDPNYDPQGAYWLGGVWPPLNYMIVRGLEAAGRTDYTLELARNHLDNMVLVMDNFQPHAIWECYSPEYPRPGTAKRGQLCRSNLVGWSGLGPIAMLLEDIIGIRANVPERTLFWRVRLTEEHGIRNLGMGSIGIDLLCEKRKRADDPIRIKVRANGAFDLCVESGGGVRKRVAVKPGRQTIALGELGGYEDIYTEAGKPGPQKNISG